YNKSSTKLEKLAITIPTRQSLHAYKLSFIHPTTAKMVKFKIKLPEDMLNLKAQLEQTVEMLDDDFEED
ncbi:RluA family pseudouridine synthase, partial [Francisella tularensis subsp. holarctica]|nr:RluA family pseudouridine synthase [Francisella tularensis subsp. holarctica]